MAVNRNFIVKNGLVVNGNIEVSGTVDGRDVSVDGLKLDGIEAGATGDMTASEILTAIKTVDGTGSGLDADLLDGQNGSYYLDWTNATNKPDPNITVSLTGDIVGSANTTLTDLANGAISIATVIQPNSVALGTDTTGNYVASITNGSYITGANGGSEGAALTLAVDATSASTASKVVARDASGNFSANTITATLNGNATTATKVNATAVGTDAVDLVTGSMADNDFFRIRVGGTATDSGFVEIATSDGGNEPIYVRQYQYSGSAFGTIARTATILDGSGNTSFPGITAAASFTASSGGTAAAPAFGFANDPNTGMFAPAADMVGFSTNGTIAAAFTSTGDLRLYNTAGTFYTEISNQPTANNTLTLPNSGNVTLVSGTMATTDTTQTISGQKSFTAVTNSFGQDGTNGYVRIDRGNTTNPGITAFYTPDNVRRGYLGWNNASNLTLVTENSWGLVLNSAATIQMAAGGSERFRISSGGFIGVGTSTTRSQLHVYGEGQITPDLFDSGLRGGMIRVSGLGTTANTGGAILFASQQGDGADSLGYAAIRGLLSDGSGNTAGHLSFMTRALTSDNFLKERVRITNDGNIGVGTSTPLALLHLTGNGSTYTTPASSNLPVVNVHNTNNANTSAHAIVLVRTGGAGGGNPFVSFDVNGEVGYAMGIDNTNNSFKLSNSWSSLTSSTRLTISSTGDVGIGTISPSEKLHVEGNVRALTFSSANGSVSSPAFDFVNDPNTGMFSLAADTIGFSTNGTIAAAFTSTGNLRLYNTAGTQYVEANSQPTATRYLNLPDANVTLTGGTMATIDTNQTFTGVKTFNEAIKSNEIMPAGGQQLILFAGESKESSGYTGLTTEHVFIVAESGLQVISSANNWTDATNGGWATKNPTVIINDVDGVSTFPGRILTNDQYVAHGATLNQYLSKRSGTYPTAMFRNDGSDFYFVKTASGASLSESFDTDRPLTINLSTGAITSSNGQTFSGGMTVNTSLKVNSVIEGADGTAAKPEYTFNSNNVVGMWHEAGALKFSTAGVERVNIGTAGNLNALNSITAVGNITNSDTIADGVSLYLGTSGTANTVTNLARIGVYKNSTLAQPNAYIRLDEADGTTQYIWLDVNDQMRYSSTATNMGTTTGNFIGAQTSDERLKEIDETFEYGINEVKKLKPIRYRFIKDADQITKLGFGAQTTQSIIPEAVFDTGECIDGYDQDPDDDMKQTPKSDRTKLAMEYVQLVPVLTKALQESLDIIDGLKTTVEELKTRLSALEDKA